jgi:uncharacterized protein (TIGR00251 family)
VSDLPFAPEEEGVRLAVRLAPRSKQSAIAGLVGDAEGRAALAVKIAAPPVEGAANKALIRYLAGALDLPRSAVKIRSGETSRLKIVHLAGDPAAIAARLSALAGG